MIYLVFYVNKSGEYCAKILRRGFACTRSELPREIKTRCKAHTVLKTELYDPHCGAAEIVLAHAKSNGWKMEV